MRLTEAERFELMRLRAKYTLAITEKEINPDSFDCLWDSLKSIGAVFDELHALVGRIPKLKVSCKEKLHSYHFFNLKQIPLLIKIWQCNQLQEEIHDLLIDKQLKKHLKKTSTSAVVDIRVNRIPTEDSSQLIKEYRIDFSDGTNMVWRDAPNGLDEVRYDFNRKILSLTRKRSVSFDSSASQRSDQIDVSTARTMLSS